MSVRTVARTDTAEWARVLRRVPHAVAHTNAYQAALDRDREVFLFVFESNTGIAAAPFAIRERAGARDLYTPYGFGGFVGVGDLSALPDAWLRFGRDSGFLTSYALLHPMLAPTGVDWGPARQDAAPVYVLPIEEDVEALLARGTPRREKRIRRWRRRWMHIEDDPVLLRRAFVSLYPQHARRVDANETYDFSTSTLQALSSLPEAFLLGARDADGALSCVALFAATGGAAEYLFLAQTEAGRVHSEGLLVEAFSRLAARGVGAVHLGGGIRPDDGVAEFKRRFGATKVVASCLKHVFEPARYEDVCRRAGVSLRTPFFPAHHATAPVALEA